MEDPRDYIDIIVKDPKPEFEALRRGRDCCGRIGHLVTDEHEKIDTIFGILHPEIFIIKTPVEHLLSVERRILNGK